MADGPGPPAARPQAHADACMAWPARTPRRRALLEYAAAAATWGLWEGAEALGFKPLLFLVVLPAWIGYFVLRGVRSPRLWRMWGIWAPPWRRAVGWHGGGLLVALAVVAVLGALQGRFVLTQHVLILAVLYPVWAFFQQFVLQNGVVANAATLGVPRTWLPVVGMAGFAVVHFPDLALVGLTAMGGLLWTWVFLRARNLYLLAVGHTIVGTAGFVWVLDRDPLANFPDILRWVGAGAPG